MHSESLQLMQDFIKKYLDPNKQLKILDVGSANIGGGTTYKSLFISNSNWIYFGGDLTQGDNVDIIFKEPYNWGLSEQFDIIISGQTLEHVEDTHKWILEIKKYLKIGGLICIIVPNRFNEHRYPVDCWRVFPDGMNFLLKKIGDFEILDIYTSGDDTIGIAKKKLLESKSITVPIFNKNVWDFCISKRYFVSIIISSHQNPEYLDNALWSILNQKVSFKYEIIIVDDASDNGIEQILLKYEFLFHEKILKYIKICTRLGYYKPLLIGSAAADGEILYIHHSDIILDTNEFIEILVKNLDEETIAVFPKEFRYLEIGFSDFNFDWKKEPNKIKLIRASVYNVDTHWFITGCIRREDLRRYTTRNFPSPEGNLEYILLKTGKKIKYIENLTAYHVKHEFPFFGEDIPCYWWSYVNEPE